MKKNIGRPKTFDKDEVVEIAMHYFWEHGYDGSSLDDLLKVMGIKKSSFYQTFKSKENLFSLTLQMYRQKISQQLFELKKEFGAKKTMLLLIENTVKELKETGKVRGCLMMNSGKECYQKYDDLSHQITIDFNFMYDLFIDFVKEAQENNEISKDKSSQVIAGLYINNLNGLASTIQAGASKEFIDNLAVSIEEILK